MLDLTRSDDTYQAQGVACVAIETRHWETAVGAAARRCVLSTRESGHPMPHTEALTAMWLGLWAAAEISSERGAAGAVLARTIPRRLRRPARLGCVRPADRRPVRYRALLALCDAERSRVDGTMSSSDWRRAVVETERARRRRATGPTPGRGTPRRCWAREPTEPKLRQR